MNHKEVWGIVAPIESPIAQKEYVTVEDLIDLPLLITSRSIVQNEIANWFKESYDHLNIIATYNLIYNAAIMVEHGIGYAISLEKLINPSSYIFHLSFQYNYRISDIKCLIPIIYIQLCF